MTSPKKFLAKVLSGHGEQKIHFEIGPAFQLGVGPSIFGSKSLALLYAVDLNLQVELSAAYNTSFLTA